MLFSAPKFGNWDGCTDRQPSLDKNNCRQRKLTASVTSHSTLAGVSIVAEDRLYGSTLCAAHGT